MKGRGYKMPVHTRVCDERIAELEAENTKLKWINNHQIFQIEKLREALSLIVSDSCSLHPSNKFMAETALKALEGKALGAE